MVRTRGDVYVGRAGCVGEQLGREYGALVGEEGGVGRGKDVRDTEAKCEAGLGKPLPTLENVGPLLKSLAAESHIT